MAEKILTLCDKCAAEMKIGGFRVKQISGRTTTEKKKTVKTAGKAWAAPASSTSLEKNEAVRFLRLGRGCRKGQAHMPSRCVRNEMR